MAQFVENVWLETMYCGECAMTFAAPTWFVEKRKEDHARWYCPMGHCRVYNGETAAQKLRRQVEQKDRELIAKNVELCDTRTRLSSVSKAHTKIRKRIANGVCPCCNRTFQNLMQHMKTQHPDFTGAQGLHALRTAFGLTQADVAKEVRVSTPYVSLFERGKPVPTRAQERIAEWIESHSGPTTPPSA
jgi:DNA-binding transcriptional regulator YiaG